MQGAIIKLDPHDIMRMKAIALDADQADALAFVKELLLKTEAAARSGLKNHLDK